jgi:hypothetical protein
MSDGLKLPSPPFEISHSVDCLQQIRSLCQKQYEIGDPEAAVKTDRKAQNYRWGIPILGRQSKVKPLFRHPIGTCNILGMCDLQTPRDAFKITERVARKLFATIRYRFSHLDNGLIWTASYRKVRQWTETRKPLIICKLIPGYEPLKAHWVPVVVAD